MPGPDWMYHPLGVALAIAGGLWLLWSLFFSGRAKGKPRCPRCWYDMAGAQGLTCPECGKTPKSSRGLLKTRRKYVQALASLLVLLLAYSAWQTPRIKRYGWPCALPNWALIAIYPIVGPPQSMARTNRALFCELRGRLEDDRLSGPARSVLARAMSPWLHSWRTQPELAFEAMSMIAECKCSSDAQMDVLLTIARQAPHELGAQALTTLVRTNVLDKRVQGLVRKFWCESDQGIPPGFTRILERRPHDPQERQAWLDLFTIVVPASGEIGAYWYASTVSQLGTDAQPLLPTLVAAADLRRSKSPRKALEIEAAIAVIRGDTPTESEFWSHRLKDPDPALRAFAATQLTYSVRELTPQSIEELRIALETEEIGEVLAAMVEVVSSHPSQCLDFAPCLRAIVERNGAGSQPGMEASRALNSIEYPW